MTYQTVRIIANPAAGQINDRLIDDLISQCHGEVPEVELYRTVERGDAQAAATRAGQDGIQLVIAVGGDGTVREVVQGMLDHGQVSDRPDLLIVPAGTGNSSYLAQWGQLAWPEAVAAALSGRGVRRVLLDLARLEELDQLVVLGACSGLVAEALVTARMVSVSGRERYRIALSLAAADFVPYPGRVLVDGVVVHEGGTVLANVGGGRHRGGRYRMLPYSILNDGLLDVCVVDDSVDPYRVPGLTETGAHLDLPGVTYARGSRITVTRTDGRPISFEHDGELRTADLSSFTLQVLPSAVPVLCRAGQEGFLPPGRPEDDPEAGRTARYAQGGHTRS